LGRVFVGAAEGAVMRGFDRLAAVHAGQGRFRRTRLRAGVAGLLALILENAPGDGTDRAALDPRVQRFQDLVRRNLAQAVDLAAIAPQLGLSPRHLNRLCLAGTGMTAVRYIEATKMREACRLLVYTRMTAQQIGYQLGFDDPSYFSRVFQRNLTLSPRAYRARFDG
jgi:AraC family transcriptional activator of pobA